MDPATLIIAALTAGAAKVGGDAAGNAYNALVRAVRRLFSNDEKAQWVLGEHVKEAAHADQSRSGTAVWEAPLRKYLADSGALQDSEIIAAAEAVLASREQGGASTQITRVSGGNVRVGRQAHLSAGGDVATGKITGK